MLGIKKQKSFAYIKVMKHSNLKIQNLYPGFVDYYFKMVGPPASSNRLTILLTLVM